MMKCVVSDYTDGYSPLLEEEESEALIQNFDRESAVIEAQSLETDDGFKDIYKRVGIVLGGTVLAVAVGGPLAILWSAKLAAFASMGGFVVGCLSTNYLGEKKDK
jgi:hypothetical protein